MIEVHLRTGVTFKGEVVKKNNPQLPFDSKDKWLCITETLTQTETYREPNAKVDKTRDITITHDVWLNKNYIDYVRRVK